MRNKSTPMFCRCIAWEERTEALAQSPPGVPVMLRRNEKRVVDGDSPVSHSAAILECGVRVID
jgi:hypothetical protein